jgi:predicted ATPase/class 3 adenylate cyclase
MATPPNSSKLNGADPEDAPEADAHATSRPPARTSDAALSVIDASASAPDGRSVTLMMETSTGTSLSAPGRPAQFTFSGRMALAPALGDRFGDQDRFEILEELGAGGMGKVFRAYDHLLDRSVAIKFIFQASSLPVEQLAALMRQEAKATARLSHENIVSIFDIGTYKDVPYIVMEHLRGETLDDVMRRDRIPPLRAIEILIGVLRGLEHAHHQGLIHRDLKPANVFITAEGRAKILDFGLAHIELASNSGGRQEGAPALPVAGTPAYMAPEQWKSEAQDARTDVWAAGVMFFEMLTGVLPFPGRDLVKLGASLVDGSPAPPVRDFEPDVPDGAEFLCTRALAKNPAQRFASASEFLKMAVLLEQSMKPGAAGSAARRGPERRQITILTAVLADPGFDGDDFADADPEDQTEVSRAFHGACNEAVAEQRGAVVLSMGGKLVACFGYPVVHEDDAQRAVRAALRITKAMRALPRSAAAADVRVGVHTGMAIVDDLHGQSGVPAIQGNVPNVAAAVAERGRSGTVTISDAARALVRGLFKIERVAAPMEAPGSAPRPTGVDVYTVIEEVGVESRFEGFVTALTPLVGRDDTIETVLAAWASARAGQGRVVVLRGEAGIGKSRLVQAVKDRVRGEGQGVTAQCWPHNRNSAFYPIIDLLKRLAGITRDQSPTDKLDRIERFVAPFSVDPAVVVPMVATLLNVPFDDRYPPISLPPAQVRARTLDTLAALVIAVGAASPLLFTIEDVHWGDHSTAELVGMLLDRVRSAKVMLLLTTRPEPALALPDRPWLQRVELGRLPPGLAAAMVEKASGGRLPPGVVEELIARTDGVPLFVEEMTRAVLEDLGDRVGRAGPSLHAIPATLHEVLLARLDRLPLAAREVAQAGAVIGRQFTYSLLRQIASGDEDTLRQSLARLVQAGLLHSDGEPPEARYQFKHALVQEAAYQVLVKRQRQEAHAKVVRVLREQRSDLVETQPELLAHHLGEAGIVPEAIDYWERAAQRSAQKSANVEAINHFRKARELVRTQPEGDARDKKELALLLGLGSPLMAVKGYASPEVREVYDRASEICLGALHEEQTFTATLGVWQYTMVSGDLPRARRLSEQLIAIAGASADVTLTLLATRAHGTTIMLMGDVAEGREATLRGLSLYDVEKHGQLGYRTGHDPGVVNGLYAAWTSWLLGEADDALRLVHDATDLARRIRHPVSIAFALAFTAMIHQYRGELEAACAAAAEGVEVARTHNLALWLAWATIQHGAALAALGRPEGIDVLRDGVARWRRTGARAGLSYFLVALAQACLEAGRLDEADAELAASAEVAALNDERYYAAERARLVALAMLARDPSRRAEAEELLAAALEMARSMRERSFELRVALTLRDLWEPEGRGPEARALIGEILGRFTQGFETADLKRARAVLQG